MGSYHADMSIRDVLSSHPDAPGVFERHGLGCPTCLAAEVESLGAVAQMHDVPVEALIAELEALEHTIIEEGD